MTARETLEAVLSRSGAERADGRALWRYGAQPEELAQILNEFRSYSSCPRTMSLKEQAALTLVVTHILCADGDARAWSWEPVWSALRWSPECLPTLYGHLSDGLELFWRRPVRRFLETERRAFLGTCFVEGGLPRSWLTADHDVGRTVRRLVALAELYQVSAASLSTDCVGKMAESIRCREVEDLCGQIADALVSLRARLPATCENPARYLDSVDPNWRANLPLRIAGESDAARVVNGFLSVAASENAVPLVEIVTVLEAAGGLCRRRVRIADQTSAQQLCMQTGLPDEHPARLLYLFIQTDTGARHQLARLEYRGEGASATWYTVRSGALPEITTTAEVRVAIGLRGEVFAEFVPPGGDLMDPNAAWVFSCTSGRAASLLGTGSCAVTQENALVFVLARYDAPSPLDAHSVVQRSEAHLEGRTAYEVRGRVEGQVGGESYLVETGAREARGTLLLRGPRLRSGCGAQAPYHGPPEVLMMGERGAVALAIDALFWRPVDHAGAWRSWREQAPAGAVAIRARDAKGDWLRTSAKIVPARFRLQSDKKASLRLQCKELLGVVADESNVGVVRDAVGGFCLSFAEAMGSADVEVVLLFRDAGPLKLKLPVPGGKAGFLDEHGAWLPNQARFGIESLDRIRARDTGTNPVWLEVRSSGAAWEGLVELRRPTTGLAEVHLEDLRDEVTTRLRASGNLDDYLEFRIAPMGSAPTRFSILQIGNYGLHLEAAFSETSANMWVRGGGEQGFSREESDRLSLWGMSLINPEMPWFPFVSTGDGSWAADFKTLTPGPYLAILRENQLIRGRPRLITVPGVPPSLPSAFSAAAMMDSTEAREVAWTGLCSEMANDWNHLEWPRFRALIRAGSPLPASCFEAMCAAARNPAFLASALLREVDPGGQREVRSEFEEAGVFWQGLPLRAWANAVRSLNRWLTKAPELALAMGGHAKALAMTSPSVFGTMAPDLRFLSVVRALGQRAMVGREAGGGERCLSLPPVAIEHVLALEAQNLLARHTDDRWPQPRLSTDMEEIAGELRSSRHPPFCLAVLRAPYVAARVALDAQYLDSRNSRALRNARAFDPEWFDAAHAFHMASLIQRDPRTYAELFEHD